MGPVRLVNRRRLRRQPLRAVLAVAAIAAGVSLAVSAVVVSGSLKASYAHFGTSVGGPGALRVIGSTVRGGLDEHVADQVAAVPGVAASVPVVQAITLDGHNLPILALGIDCRAEALVGSFGCNRAAIASATRNAPPMVGPGVAVAGNLIRTDDGPLAVQGATVVPQLGRLNAGRVVVFPLPVAQQVFARPGTVDAVYVKPAPGVSPEALRRRLAGVVGAWNAVLPASTPPVGSSLATGSFVMLFGMLSLFALGVGAVLVHNTVALSLEERRRHLAVFGALGAPPRAIAVAVAGEAAVLGLAGGVAGVFGGVALARPITKSMGDFASRITGLTVGVHVSARPVITGVLLGTVLAVVAAMRPARRAMRLDVAAELSGREVGEAAATRSYLRRALVWVVIGLTGIVMTWLGQRHGALEPWQPALAQVGVLVAVLGLVLATGSLAPVVVRGCRGLTERFPAAGRLGVGNVERDAARTGVMTVAVASSVGIAFVIASFAVSVQAGISHGIARGTAGRLRVASIDGNNTVNLDSRLSPRAVAALDQLKGPGVARVDHVAELMVGHSDPETVGVIGTDRQDLPFGMIVGRFDPAQAAAGKVVVGPGLARKRHLRPGSKVTLPGLHGMATFEVMGIYSDGDFNGSTVLMSLTQMERVWGPQPIEAVLLAGPGGTAPPLHVVNPVFRERADPFLFVQTPQGVERSISQVLNATMRPFWVLQRGMLLVAFIAVASTLLLIVLQRRRELGMLGAIGATPGQLRSVLITEAATVGVVGSALGALAGIGMFEAMREVTPTVIGYLEPFRLDPRAVAVYGPVTIAAVLIAALWPAVRAGRVPIVEALQYE